MMRAGNRSGRAVLGGLFVWVVLLWSLGFAASSDAQEFDYYLIIDGPGFGVLLFTPAGQFTVERFNAVGNIGGQAGDHCDGALHFHGTIGGLADPDPPGCGWGKVAQVAGSTLLQRSMSDAIGYELLAQRVLAEAPPRYIDVIHWLRESLRYLDDVKFEVSAAKDSGQVDQRAADRIIQQIDVAKRTEQQAIDALTRLNDGNGEPKDRQAAERDIGIALEDKARVVRSLRKANLSP